MTRVVVDTDVVSFIFKNHPIGALYEADLAGCTLLGVPGLKLISHGQ
ncbi:MAG: hypothetical protein ABSF62_24390 [Bryobacteraceae bacterium]|jgi:hypothetical protein